ncbi:hypothetical protein RHMOL_Rhmol09G0269000 [Rhododendron molle]|uniref:Uncharacterized protein n=1 Tax=Rhododendron molle TaxID=49168 RepID=A0ACC0MHZ4_RHOML|nr:hypothetical protein RHMOL_Rhmol09G0269000 [Rhododendron molle]
MRKKNIPIIQGGSHHPTNYIHHLPITYRPNTKQKEEERGKRKGRFCSILRSAIYIKFRQGKSYTKNSLS